MTPTQEMLDAMTIVNGHWPFPQMFRREVLGEIEAYLLDQLHPPRVIMDRHEPVWYSGDFAPLTSGQSDQ